jgi:tetratricopeptide (TPR) repeat protein
MLQKYIGICFVLLGFAVAVFSQEATTLELGKILEREISATEKHLYTIKSTANQYIFIDLQQKGVDVFLKLYEPNGQLICEVDYPNGTNGPEVIEAAFENAGEYLLEITVTGRAVKQGKYNVTIKEQREAKPTDYVVFRAMKAFNQGLILRPKRTQPDLLKAAEKFQEAANLFQEVDDKIRRAHSIHNKAFTLQTMGEDDAAIETYKLAIQAANQAGDFKNVSDSYNNIGFIKNRLSLFQDALFFYRKSLEIDRLHTVNSQSEVVTVTNIAVAYHSLGILDKAESYLNEAIEIAKKNKNQGREAIANLSLGQVYFERGEIQKAFDLHQKVLHYFKTINNPGFETRILGTIANQYFLLGNYVEAKNYFSQQLALATSNKDGGNAGNANQGLGKTYSKLGENAKAIEHLEAGSKLNGRDARFAAINYLWLAETKRKGGENDEAEANFKKAVDLIESNRNRISAQELRTAYFSKNNKTIYEAYVSFLMGVVA